MLDLLVHYGLPFGAGLFAYRAARWLGRQPLLEKIKILEDSVELWEEMYDDLRDRKYATDRENAALKQELARWKPDNSYHRCKYDDFIGQRIGTYITREGRVGYVLQEIGNRVVHVYATANLLDYHVIEGGKSDGLG